MAVENLYVIHDRKALYFGTPNPARNDNEAFRLVQDAIEYGDTILAKHPEDFDLYEIGSYDNTSGLLKPTIPPRIICSLIPCKALPAEE